MSDTLNSNFSDARGGDIDEINRKALSISVIGEQGIGKTSLVRQLRTNTFDKNQIMTTGAVFSMKQLALDEREVNLRIIDVAGQASFSVIRKNFMRRSDGAIMVFSLNSRRSFDAISEWIHDFLSANRFNHKLPILLVGNKSDLVDERMVSEADVKRLINHIIIDSQFSPNIIGYIETSAKTGNKVHEAFYQLTMGIHQVHGS